jgi:hypothetical protein
MGRFLAPVRGVGLSVAEVQFTFENRTRMQRPRPPAPSAGSVKV